MVRKAARTSGNITTAQGIGESAGSQVISNPAAATIPMVVITMYGGWFRGSSGWRSSGGEDSGHLRMAPRIPHFPVRAITGEQVGSAVLLDDHHRTKAVAAHLVGSSTQPGAGSAAVVAPQ